MENRGEQLNLLLKLHERASQGQERESRKLQETLRAELGNCDVVLELLAT